MDPVTTEGPPASSWLKLVERWTAELTTKQLARGAPIGVSAAGDGLRLGHDLLAAKTGPSPVAGAAVKAARELTP